MSKKNKASKKNKTKVAKVKASPKSPSLKWYGIAVALLGFLLYANTLSHDYCLDDFSAIKDNFVVKQGTKGIPTLLKEHYRFGYWSSKGTLYRPLTLVMFALEWQLAPDNPYVGHLMNVLFFAWTGWLLFQLLSLLFGDKYRWLPLIVSLIFIAHPVHTEVVANIKSRDEIMAFFLGLAALYYLIKFVDTDKIHLFLISILLYGLSLFSKESAITWLGIFPLTIWFFRKDKIKKAIYTLAFLVPTGIFLMIRSKVVGSSVDVSNVNILDNFFAQASGAKYYGSAFYMVFRYLKTLFLPTELVSDLGFNQIPLTTFGNISVLTTLILIIGSIFYVFKNRNTQPPNVAAYGILFFAITFSIYSNLIVTIGSSYGERFLYIPSLGFALVLGYGLHWLAQKINKPFDLNFSHPIFLGLVLLLLGYSFKTIQRNKDWYDSATLYASDIPKSPNSAKLNYHHGLEVGKKGNKLSGASQVAQYKKALKFFEKAVKIDPKYADAYALQGLYYFKLKDYDKAMTAYHLAIKNNANSPNAYNNMGIIYFQRGDVKNAERVYKLALKYNPRFVDAYRNLGAVYGSTRRFAQAIEQFKKGLQYDPNNQTLLKYIASAYRDLGKPELGKPYLDRVKK